MEKYLCYETKICWLLCICYSKSCKLTYSYFNVNYIPFNRRSFNYINIYYRIILGNLILLDLIQKIDWFLIGKCKIYWLLLKIKNEYWSKKKFSYDMHIIIHLCSILLDTDSKYSFICFELKRWIVLKLGLFILIIFKNFCSNFNSVFIKSHYIFRVMTNARK